MPRDQAYVLGARIDALTMDEAVGRIARWGAARESRYVCICNVHSVVIDHPRRRVPGGVNGADMATPDGAPIAWALRRRGHFGAIAARRTGPDVALPAPGASNRASRFSCMAAPSAPWTC